MNPIRSSRRPFAAFTHVVVDSATLLADFAKFQALVDQVRWCCQKLGGVAGWQGTLCLFLDSTWQNLFLDLQPGGDFNVATWKGQTRELRTRMEAALREAACPVRLIMADDLERLLADTPNPPEGRTRSRLLAGEVRASRYDVPKLAKWLIQALNLGVPVATFDWDVLSNGSRSSGEAIAKRFANSAELLLKATTSADLVGRSFVMSGQYLDSQRSLAWGSSLPAWVDWELDALNGSATRTAFLCQTDPATGALAMQFDAVRAFFRSLNSLGLAPPFGVSISGAGQIMSDSCLAFPPWTHFRWNVVWCDDYLLSAFHIARGLIAADTPCIEQAATFVKPRVVSASSLTQRDVDWHRDNYFPGLILGSIVCAWASRDVVTRMESGALSPAELWELSRSQLNRIVAEWTQPIYATTWLAAFMNGATSSPFAPQGIARAVADLPANFPGFATAIPAMPSLQESLQTLIEDFLMIPESQAYWRKLLAAFESSATSATWTI